jgi:hypothetical protein
MLLPNQKSAAKNFTIVESEIDSQKLCRCRFKNQQPKTLLMQKSATKNFAAADSEIGSQLCCCRIRNRYS